MAISVNWHNDALRDLTDIVDYLESAGEIQAAYSFKERMIDRIDFVSKYPGVGRPSKSRKNLRYILIDKHRRMYYRYTSRALTILAFFDASQDPNKAPF